ncbi:MAG: hydrolase [Bacillus sp. (in: firmicutes)]
MEKNLYYVDIKSGDISEEEPGHGGGFRIFADEEEYKELQHIALRMYNDELKTYVRSHVPFVDYNFKEKNGEYDRQLIKLYEKIYMLGDHETKRHIEKMDILNKEQLNDRSDF